MGRAFVVLAVAAMSVAGCSTDSADSDQARQCVTELAWPDATVVVAGTGALLPFARSVATSAAVAAVPESIGSSGGLAALADGEIDIALAARPPSDADQAESLRVIELPSARVAVLAHPASASGLTLNQLTAIIEGRVDRWPDGTPLVYFLREPGDSSERAMVQEWPELSAAFDVAREQRKWTVTYSDQAMLSAIDETPGALGVLDTGLGVGATNALQIVWPVDVPVRELAVADVTLLPTKPLFMVVREDIDANAAMWLQDALEQAPQLLSPPWYVEP
jgi:phosphate transport system substrate-binding protein